MSRANPRYRRNNLALPPLTGNVYRVRIFGSIEGQLTISTFYYQDSNAAGTATVTHANNLHTAFVAAGNVGLTYLACCSVDWSSTYVWIDSPNTPSLAPQPYVFSNTGGGSAGHEPTEVAAVLTRGSASRGQCGRGRVSVPAVPTNVVTASRITGLTAYNALANSMLAVIASGGDTFTPVIFSKNGSRVHSFQGASQVTIVTPLGLLGTVRRRKIGRGK